MTTADTPYAILCSECVPGHTITIALSEREYLEQMNRPSRKWHCPECGEEAVWDDDTYEAWLDHNQDTLTEEIGPEVMTPAGPSIALELYLHNKGVNE